MFWFRWGALALVLIILMLAALRLRGTLAGDPEHAARLDQVKLLVVILAAQVLELVRSRLAPTTRPFWALSLLLLPFAVAALYLLARLYSAYRVSASKSHD